MYYKDNQNIYFNKKKFKNHKKRVNFNSLAHKNNKTNTFFKL